MNKRNIDLHIEELVLHGVSIRDRKKLRAAIEDELSNVQVDSLTPPLGNDRMKRSTGHQSRDGSDSEVKRVASQVARDIRQGLSIGD